MTTTLARLRLRPLPPSLDVRSLSVLAIIVAAGLLGGLVPLAPSLVSGAVIGIVLGVLIFSFPMAGLSLTMAFTCTLIGRDAVGQPFRAGPVSVFVSEVILALLITRLLLDLPRLSRGNRESSPDRLPVILGFIYAAGLVISGITSLLAGTPLSTMLAAGRHYIDFTLFFIILFYLRTSERVEKWCKILVGLGCVTAAGQVLEPLLGHAIPLSLGSVRAETVPGTGWYRMLPPGMPLVWFASFVLLALALGRTTSHRLVYIALWLVTVASIGAGFVRAQWLAWVLAIGLLLISSRLGRVRIVPMIIALVAVWTLVTSGVGQVFIPAPLAGPIERTSELLNGSILDTDSGRFRIIELNLAWAAFQKAPITGIGIGRGYGVVETRYTANGSYQGEVAYMHNSYFGTLLYFGVMGGVGLFGLLLLAFVRGWPEIVAFGHRPSDPYLAGSVLALIGIVIYAGVEVTFLEWGSFEGVIVILATVFALYRVKRHGQPERAEQQLAKVPNDFSMGLGAGGSR